MLSARVLVAPVLLAPLQFAPLQLPLQCAPFQFAPLQLALQLAPLKLAPVVAFALLALELFLALVGGLGKSPGLPERSPHAVRGKASERR